MRNATNDSTRQSQQFPQPQWQKYQYIAYIQSIVQTQSQQSGEEKNAQVNHEFSENSLQVFHPFYDQQQIHNIVQILYPTVLVCINLLKKYM